MNLPTLDWSVIHDEHQKWRELVTNEKNHVHVDFESYYDDEYSLRKQDMTYIKYITDPRFKLQSVAIATGRDGKNEYVRDKHVIEAIRDTVTSDKILIAQNTQFDGLIATQICGVTPAGFGDLLGMSRAIFPHARSHSIDAQAIRLFPDDESLRKGDDLIQTKGVPVLSDYLHSVLEPYNLQDTHLLRKLFYKYLDDYNFPIDELIVIDILTQMYCVPSIKADRPLLVTTMNEAIMEQDRKVSAALEFIEENVHIEANDGMNFLTVTDNRDKSVFKTIKSYQDAYKWNFDIGPVRSEDERQKFLSSNDKFAKILQEGFDIQVPMKPSNGKTKDETYALAVNDVEFQQMRAENRDLDVLWEGRISSKSNQAATRAATMIDASDAMGGLLPIPLKYGAAHTGRFGGGQKLNPQNYGRGSNHRLALTGGEDLNPVTGVIEPHVIGVADSSNIEARTSAWFCGHEEKLHLFETGGDPYLAMAERIYNKMAMNKKEHKEERGVGKATELGCGYGMGDKRFRNYLNAGPMGMPPIFLEDIEALQEYANPYKYVIMAYRDYNWPIAEMWRKLESVLFDMQFESTDYMLGPVNVVHEKMILPNGLYIHYPELKKRAGQWSYKTAEGYTNLFGGKVLENIIQALSRIVVTDQMIWTACHLKAYGGRVVLQVHDEIVSRFPSFGAKRKDVEVDGKIEHEWVDAEYIEALQETCNAIMCRAPDWCADIPLDSEGGFDLCYSK